MPRFLRALAALALCALPIAASGAAPAERYRCPDLSGTYRVTGDDPLIRETLQALGFGRQGAAGSRLTVAGKPAEGVHVALRGNETGHALEFSTQYSCTDGWLVFVRPHEGHRGDHRGQSQIRIKRTTAALEIELAFSGSKWVTLYSYDSANVSVPLPFTGTTHTATLVWPLDQTPERVTEPDRPPPERTELVAVRNLLAREIVGGMQVGSIEARGDAVLVSMTARKLAEVSEMEQRLRAASIRYEMRRAPIWSDRSYYLQVLVWPPPATAGRRPPR